MAADIILNQHINEMVLLAAFFQVGSLSACIVRHRQLLRCGCASCYARPWLAGWQDCGTCIRAELASRFHTPCPVLVRAFERKQVHGRDSEGLELLATIPPGHTPGMAAQDLDRESRPRVSLAAVLAAGRASECWDAATLVGCVPSKARDEGVALFDAAAVGVFVGGPRRDSPQPEVLPTRLAPAALVSSSFPAFLQAPSLPHRMKPPPHVSGVARTGGNLARTFPGPRASHSSGPRPLRAFLLTWPSPARPPCSVCVGTCARRSSHMAVTVVGVWQARVFFAFRDGLWVPHVYNESALSAPVVRLHNLHIHSKDIELFLITGAAVEVRGAACEEHLERNVNRAQGGWGDSHSASCAPHAGSAWQGSRDDISTQRDQRAYATWVQTEVAESRFARLLWAVDEELDEDLAGAASLGLEMSVLSVRRQGLGATTLLAACVSAGRALVLLSSTWHHAGATRGDESKVLWRLSTESSEGAQSSPPLQAPPEAVRRRFCSPHLVERTGGGDVWLLWSTCVGRDSTTGGGGGVGKAADKARCVSWISRWVSRDRSPPSALVSLAPRATICDCFFADTASRWSEPERLSQGAVAGQPTLSSHGLHMYVPVVEWKEVAWSNQLLHNATGLEVHLCVDCRAWCRKVGQLTRGN